MTADWGVRCPVAHSELGQCVLRAGHEGNHETAPRCQATDPAGNQCTLPAGHGGNHMTDSDLAHVQSAQPLSPPALPTAVGVQAGINVPALVVLVGGALYAIGSALPWITATAAFVGTITRSGLEGGDGIITIVIGLLIALVGLLSLNGSRSAGSKVAQVLLCAVALGLAVWEVSNVNAKIDDLEAGELAAIASVGIGLWMMVIGGALALLGALASGRAPKTG